MTSSRGFTQSVKYECSEVSWCASMFNELKSTERDVEFFEIQFTPQRRGSTVCDKNITYIMFFCFELMSMFNNTIVALK